MRASRDALQVLTERSKLFLWDYARAGCHYREAGECIRPREPECGGRVTPACGARWTSAGWGDALPCLYRVASLPREEPARTPPHDQCRARRGTGRRRPCARHSCGGARGGWILARHYSAEIFAALMISPHRMRSLRICAANCAGVLPTSRAPDLAKRSCMAGVRTAAAISLCSRAITSGGVPAGAAMPNHDDAS